MFSCGGVVNNLEHRASLLKGGIAHTRGIPNILILKLFLKLAHEPYQIV
jgi:hypothetical protein